MLDSRYRQEQGFTIIEVIVAVLIVAILAGALMTVMGSTSKDQTRAKVIARQQSIVDGVIKKINGDPAILRDTSVCAADGGCAAATPLATTCPASPSTQCTTTKYKFTASSKLVGNLIKEPEGTIVKHNIEIVSMATDDAADGVGQSGPNRDQDGLIPDRYIVEVRNTTTAKGMILSPETRTDTATYVGTTVINNAKRTGVGTMILTTCAVSQVDERMPVGLCTGEERTLEMRPPAGCNSGSTSHECTAWEAAKSAGPGTSGFKYGPTEVGVIPVTGLTYGLQGPLRKTNNTVRSGLVVGETVPDLEPGEYKIILEPPSMDASGNVGSGAPMQVWATHSIPGDGRVSIEAGALKQATILFKPRVGSTPPHLEAHSFDQSYPTEYALLSDAKSYDNRAWHVRPAALSNLVVKLVPVPSTRTNLARTAVGGASDGAWANFTRWDRTNGYPLPDINNPRAPGTIPPSSQRADLPATLEPGLYAAYIVHNQAGLPFGAFPLLRRGDSFEPGLQYSIGYETPDEDAFVKYVFIRPNQTGSVGSLYNQYCLGNAVPGTSLKKEDAPRELWIDKLCGVENPWCWIFKQGIYNFVGGCGENAPATGTGAGGSGGV